MIKSIKTKVECEHKWVTKNFKFAQMGLLGQTLEIPCKCKLCGKTGSEVWIFSCYIEY